MDRRLLLLIPIIIGGLLVAFYPIDLNQGRTSQPLQLTAAEWSLQSLVNSGLTALPLDNTRITVQFDEEGRASGSGSCNTFFGEYQIIVEYQISAQSVDGIEEQGGVGGSISLDNIAWTERACAEPGRMEQEGEFFASLREVTRFEVTTDSLKLFSQDEPPSTVLSFVIE